MAIVILFRGKCGLSKCITSYLVGMAASDLMVVVSDPVLNWISVIYFPDSFLNFTPVCSFIMFLLYASRVVSVWITVAFTFDRFVTICYDKLKTKYCTEKTAAAIIATVSVLGCLEAIPWYFVSEPRYLINNIPWECMYQLSFFTSPIWIAFDMFHLILTPCIPFFLILLLNILTVRRILLASRVRSAFHGRNIQEDHVDPEMENRKRSIILLFSISGSFVLLWATQVLFCIYRRITHTHSYSHSDNLYATESAATMLQLLSTCTNTCIYVLTQTKFRQQLKNMIEYPFIAIIQCGKFK
ncbi:probable G-protein coupled receptor 139 [Scyliorhinus canicula]|uniref:probable G-protein coupled receptor 139 n=1 Tax=Scyliorhinus canicula TaxID=7830 RepID=UPI0018F40322|nr:probable G-protein coupled receptor 139 [Scyliorhinus canicula]